MQCSSMPYMHVLALHSLRFSAARTVLRITNHSLVEHKAVASMNTDGFIGWIRYAIQVEIRECVRQQEAIVRDAAELPVVEDHFPRLMIMDIGSQLGENAYRDGSRPLRSKHSLFFVHIFSLPSTRNAEPG